MHLQTITIENLRRIGTATLSCGAETHLIYGANGSGKTTVLEAIHLLSGGRSFRTARAADLIQHGTDHLLITGVLHANGARHAIGLEKSRRKTRFHLNEEAVRSASTVVRLMPVIVLNSDSSRLLEGGPSNRRALVDRLLFHVEPDYLTEIRQYYHLLKQRNISLRRGLAQNAIVAWDEQLAGAGERIHAQRQGYVQRLADTLTGLISELDLGQPELRYQPGWDTEHSLREHLSAALDKDRRLGSTSAGPHRAEIKVMIGEKSAKTMLSRGQVKLLVTALITSLVRVLHEVAGIRPILLIDDLAAELDETSKLKAIQLLTATKTQAFFTSIEYNTLPELMKLSPRVFHVEQGEIKAT